MGGLRADVERGACTGTPARFLENISAQRAGSLEGRDTAELERANDGLLGGLGVQVLSCAFLRAPPDTRGESILGGTTLERTAT